MKVSVIVRSYNEAQHIGKLLAGLSVQSLRPHEVIVVDSGSTDGTADIARRSGANVIEIDKREFTFGRALNIGCRAATGDILVFASSHVYPTRKSWLNELVQPFEDERVVLSYGKQRGSEINKYSEHQIFKVWFPERSIAPQRNYFCNNANCAIRRSVWEQQNYDETLTGLEDLDWAKRAQEAGAWIAYTARAEIIHVHDESWASVRNRYRREAMALRRIDQAAHFGMFDFVRSLSANIISDLMEALREGKLALEARSIFLFRYNQFVGTFRGHNGPGEVTAELRRIFYFPKTSADPDDVDRHPPREELIDYDRVQNQFMAGVVRATDKPATSGPRLAVVRGVTADPRQNSDV